MFLPPECVDIDFALEPIVALPQNQRNGNATIRRRVQAV
jgi:hypothetical protein